MVFKNIKNIRIFVYTILIVSILVFAFSFAKSVNINSFVDIGKGQFNNLNYDSAKLNQRISGTYAFSGPQKADLISVKIDFKFEVDCFSDTPQLLFQTAQGDSGIKLELLKPSDADLIIGCNNKSGRRYIDIASDISINKLHSINIVLDANKQLRVTLDNLLLVNKSASEFDFILKELSVGRGFSKDTSFSGRISDFNILYTFYKSNIWFYIYCGFCAIGFLGIVISLLLLNNNLFNEKIINKFILFAGIASLLPFILISYYNYPSADDFNYSAVTNNLGFWKAQVFWYLNWSGRYFSSAILSLNPLIFNSIILYRSVSILLILLIFISMFYLSGSIFDNISYKQRVTLSLVFCSIYFFNMPSIAEGLFWFPGAITYQLANVLVILFIVSIIKMYSKNKIIFFILSVLMLFAVIGSNETSMILIDLLLFMFLIFNILLSKKINNPILLLFLIAIIFSAIVIFCPGNVVRESAFANNHQLFFSIKMVIQEIGNSIPATLPFAIMMLVLMIDYANRHGLIVSYYQSALIHITLLSIIIVLLVGFFPAYWVTGMKPPLRTVNTVYFFFIILLSYYILQLNNMFKSKYSIEIILPFWCKLIIILALLFNALVVPNNIKIAYLDLIEGKAQKYSAQMSSRYKIIENSVSDVCYVPPLIDKPDTLFFDDITDKADDWRNQSFSQYMKKKAIIIGVNEK